MFLIRICSTIFILSLFYTTSFAKDSRHPSNSKDSGKSPSKVFTEFVSTSGLLAGEYQLAEKQPEQCREGEIEILDLTDSVTVMLGAHALVVGLGRDKFDDLDRDCLSEYDTFYKKNFIKGTMVEKCEIKGQKNIGRYHTEIQVKDRTIIYTRTITLNEQKPTSFSCELKLKKE
ncbi:MAG: hypothetical protein KDD50_10735 [Bdellovibrionales bacterium]|nr:hypothetical protein [Bdellovibrionales bacterium]